MPSCSFTGIVCGEARESTNDSPTWWFGYAQIRLVSRTPFLHLLFIFAVFNVITTVGTERVRLPAAMRVARKLMIHLSVLPLIEQYGVFIVAALIMFGEMGIPTGISAEVALLLTGAYAIHSVPELLAGIFVIALADLIGTTLLFLAMRSGGNSLVRRVLRRLHKDETASIDRWRKRLEAHQSRVVFAVRLLPLMRMYIAITTGLLRIRARAFVLGAAPAAAIWVGLPVAAGFALRTNVQELQARYTTVTHLVVLISPMAGAIGAIAWWIRSGATRSDRIRRVRVVAGFSTATAGAIYLATSTWILDHARARGQMLVDLDHLEFWMAALAASVIMLLVSGAGDLRLRSTTIGALAPEATVRFNAIGGWRTVITTGAIAAAIAFLVLIEQQLSLL